VLLLPLAWVLIKVMFVMSYIIHCLSHWKVTIKNVVGQDGMEKRLNVYCSTLMEICTE